MGWDNIHLIFTLAMVFVGVATVILAQVAIKFYKEIAFYEKWKGKMKEEAALEESLKDLREEKEDLIIERHERR
jgi:hypothetical protein